MQLKLEKRGLYIAENMTNHEQYLVAISGIAPMLRVANVISISNFVKNQSTEEPLSTLIEENVNNFTWTPLEHKIAIDTSEKKEEIKKNVSDFQSLVEKREKYIELTKDGITNAALELCIDENISIEMATEAIKQFKLSLQS